MKVAENKTVDLDLFPGTHEEKLQQQAEALYVSLTPHRILPPSLRIPLLPLSSPPPTTEKYHTNLPPHSSAGNTENLSPEVREKIQSVSQGATAVGTDTLNTVGGGVKGVVDTAGNTVGTLGGGLSDTVSGVAGGLGQFIKLHLTCPSRTFMKMKTSRTLTRSLITRSLLTLWSQRQGIG